MFGQGLCEMRFIYCHNPHFEIRVIIIYRYFEKLQKDKIVCWIHNIFEKSLFLLKIKIVCVFFFKSWKCFPRKWSNHAWVKSNLTAVKISVWLVYTLSAKKNHRMHRLFIFTWICYVQRCAFCRNYICTLFKFNGWLCVPYKLYSIANAYWLKNARRISWARIKCDPI